MPFVRRERHEPSSRTTWRSKTPVPFEEKAIQRAPGVVMAQGGRTMTPSDAEIVAPPDDAVRVTVTSRVTGVVSTEKVAPVAPATTVTLAGTVADALLEVSVTTAPPAGAAPASVTVPVAPAPPCTFAGDTLTDESAGTGGGSKVIVRSPETLSPATSAVM